MKLAENPPKLVKCPKCENEWWSQVTLKYVTCSNKKCFHKFKNPNYEDEKK